ncbi:MAG: PAS domain-containing protein [Betaproteobacteria bacterium]|nr:PAS domain-containing protein [Betaproteobacteria bacterium]
MTKPQASSGRPESLRLTLTYALFATLWILFSDHAVQVMFTDPETIVRVSMLKGWLFVIVTSALLFVVTRRLFGRLDSERIRQNELYEERLRAQQLIEAIAEGSDDAMFAKDRDGRYILFNRAASEFVGKPPAAVLGYDDHAIFPPDQAEMLIAAGRTVIEKNVTFTAEERLTTPAGEKVFLATKGPLRDADGRVIGIFGISRDITERSNLEAQLRDRDERLTAIVNHSPSALTLKTPDGHYAAANPHMQRIHNLSEAEIVGKTDFDLYPEETARSFQANDALIVRTRQRHSIEEIVPIHGEARTYMSHMFPVINKAGDIRYICRISLDITETKRAQAEVKQLTDDLTATLHAIPDLLFELDETGRYVKVEATAINLLAAPPTELLGHTLDEILPADAAQTVKMALACAGETGTDYGRTISLQLPDGLHHFELSVARKAMHGGPRQHFVVLSRDITARRNNELELRRNNLELERFNAASVGREIQMIALKQQINDLSRQLGLEAPFDLDFADQAEKGRPR